MNTQSVQKKTNSKKLLKPHNTYSNPKPLVKTLLFGVWVTNETSKNILEYIVNFLQKTHKNMYIVTPNPEMIMLAQKDSAFMNALNNADLALCDGIGLYRGSQLLGSPLKERIIGTDFVERLCEMVGDWPITVGFLGGGAGVAERAAECLKARLPGLKVVFAEAEWPTDRGPVAPHPAPTASFDDLTAGARAGSPSRITPNQFNPAQDTLNDKSQLDFSSLQNGHAHGLKDRVHSNSKIQNPIPKIDILFVALGAPKQELWMAEHIDKIRVRVMMGVGGALDQIVDKSLRPPTLMHTLGLGWLYRLIREPWRIKRQVSLVPFMWLVLKEKLK